MILKTHSSTRLTSAILIVYFFFIFQTGFGAEIATYWISFKGFTDSIDVMKIDQFGTVLRQPVVVLKRSDFGKHQVGTPALSQGTPGRLLLWIGTFGETSLNPGNIYRTRLAKEDLKVLSLHNTSIKDTNAYSLQLTGRDLENFIVVEREANSFNLVTGYAIERNGALIGNHFRMSSQTAGEVGCSECASGVSADARYAWIIDEPISSKMNLYVQRLGIHGRAIKAANLVTTVHGSEIKGADITSLLSSGIRFLVYVITRNSPEESDKIFLQRIDDDTGTNLGEPILIASESQIKPFQSIAIDPHGKFLIYAVESLAAVPRGLKFQALDATGSPSGTSKFITHKANLEIDILEEE